MSAMSVKAAALILGLSLGAAAQAGGARVGFALVVPVGPMAPVAAPMFHVPVAPVVPIAPVFATTIIQQPLAPVLAPSFVPGFVPGFVPAFAPGFVPGLVPVSPQVVIAPTMPMLAAPGVVPLVPVIAPSAPLFFAPPIQTVISPSPGGQLIIIRGSGF